jgi:hypothetical protein
VAFDQSGLRWLGISNLIAEPEGPTFISYKVARSRLDRLRFVTQDPARTFGATGWIRTSDFGLEPFRVKGIQVSGMEDVVLFGRKQSARSTSRTRCSRLSAN